MSFFQTINGFDLLLAMLIVGLAFMISMERKEHNDAILKYIHAANSRFKQLEDDINHHRNNSNDTNQMLHYTLDFIGREEELKLYIEINKVDYFFRSKREKQLIEVLRDRHYYWYTKMKMETDDLEFVNLHKIDCSICSDVPF